MSMKNSHADDTKPLPSSTRRHVLSRLHKAQGYAEQLVNALQDKLASGASTTDVLEARAYVLCIAGAGQVEKWASQQISDAESSKAAWHSCLASFSAAHVILTALLQQSGKDAYREVLAGTVDPSIRYAAYQSRIPRTTGIEVIAKQHFDKDQKTLLADIEALHPSALSEEANPKLSTTDDATATASIEIPTTVTWRSRTVPIADPAIGQALAATSVAASQLSATFSSSSSNTTTTGPQNLASAYDAVLTASQDAIDATRHALVELSRSGVSESDARTQDLRVMDLYVNFALISWRIGRNRVLISAARLSSPTSTTDDGLLFSFDSARAPPARIRARIRQPNRPQRPSASSLGRRESRAHALARLRARVVLYDSTLQSLDALAALRGAARDEGLQAELAGRRAYFAALRALNVGHSHALLGAHAQALALFARAALHAASASSADDGAEPDAGAPPTLAVSRDQVAAVRAHVGALVTRQRGLVSLHALPVAAAATPVQHERNALPLASRLDEFPEPCSTPLDLANIVAWPPRLQPVPVKPIFLDLAWNYIEYPGGSGSLGEADAVDAAEEAGGGGEEMEGVMVQGVKAVVGTAVETVVGSTSQPAKKEEGAAEKPKKRGWFGFGRG